MTTDEILKILQDDIHTVIVATVDLHGKPYTCAIDLMLLENKMLYFLTARGKAFYQRLMNNPYISLTGLKGQDTMSTISISLQGKVTNIGHKKLEEIFEKNTYMKQIYPTFQAREALEVFVIKEIVGEYFDLSKKPIFRQSFSISKDILTDGYYITDKCNGCKKCYEVCPQKCIKINQIPAIIYQQHCLHCGRCQEICPVKAIQKVNHSS